MVDLLQVRNSRLLSGLDEEQLGRLASISQEVSNAAGRQLFRLGDPADTLYLVKTGVVELIVPVTVLGVTSEMVVTKQTRGDALAWSALVEPNVLTLSARAKTDVTLFGFPRSKLLGLCEAEPSLGFILMRNFGVVVGRRLDLTLRMWFAELERSVSDKYQ